VRLVRVDLENSTRRSQGGALGPLWLWTWQSQIPIPCTINAGFDVCDESVHLVSGQEFRVRVFEAGRLSEIYGVARDAREVSGADIAAYRAFIEEYYPESLQDDYLSTLGHPSRPTVMPAYSRLLAAADGHTWAQVYSPDFSAPANWDVYDASREWVGQVQNPRRVHDDDDHRGRRGRRVARRSGSGARSDLSNSTGLRVQRHPPWRQALLSLEL